MTCAAFSIKFAKTTQKFAENSEFVKKIHYFSKLFTGVLRRDVTARGGQTPPAMEAFLRQNLLDIQDTQRELREGKRMSLNDQRRPTQQRRAAVLEGSISNLTLIFQPND